MNRIPIENAIEEVDCAYGRIAFFRHDLYLGRSLREYGEWAQRELDFLKSLTEDGSVVIDAGAFIGTHTIAFSSFVGPQGRVYAFEPHPVYFRALQRNIRANKLKNVKALNFGLSDRSGKMQVQVLDLGAPNSLGSVSLQPTNSGPNMATVNVTTLDKLRLDACDLIKVDVEGMEGAVLTGARSTIERHQPFVYAECNSADGGWPVVLMMRSLGYQIYLYSEEAYNPNNFRKNPLNIFGRARELGLMCVPSYMDNAFKRRLSPSLDVIRIERLDDLVLCLIKKPQYKQEILANSNGARLWGNDFWMNEGELETAQAEANKKIQALFESQKVANDRAAEIAQLSDRLDKTDAALAEARKFALERSKEIAALSQDVAARDGQIASLNQVIAERDSQVANLRQAVIERDGQIASLDLVVAERAGKITALNQTVAERDAQIAGLALEKSTMELSHKAHAGELEKTVFNATLRIEELKRELNGKVLDIDAILSSRSWRLTAPLRAAARLGKQAKSQARRLTGNTARAAYHALPLSFSRKQQLKGVVFRILGFALSGTGAFQRWKALEELRRAERTAAALPLPAIAPSYPVELRGLAELPNADGRWEWADYPHVSGRISEANRLRRESFEPNPMPMIDIDNEDPFQVADRVTLPAPGEHPQVSIIIPVFNQVKLTLECLLSICTRTGTAVSYEIIIADDASTDETPSVLGRIPNLRIRRNKKNLGFLRNCNSALPDVHGQYVLFLNNDVQVMDGWLGALLATFQQHERVGAVGPMVLYPSGHLQEAGNSLRSDGTSNMVGLNEDPDQPRFRYARRVDYCSGAALMLPAELLRSLGGFSDEFAPCYCEDSDLCLKVQEAGYYVYFNPASKIVHHLSKTTDAAHADFKLKCIARNLMTLSGKWQDRIDQLNLVRFIAFYLPQFHPIPENDHWWGPGFTEWSNVTRARPNFVGHYQPRLPADLGYYDLRVPEMLEQQAQLAKRYGVYGFCFYYYWFGGRRPLDMPIERMLKTGSPDMPFCLCWANENWTRRWDGQDNEILIGQAHSDEDDHAVIRDLIRYFRDRRYIRIDNRPLILVYRVTLFPDFAATARRWREACRREGVGEIYIAMVESFDLVHSGTPPRRFECDAAVEFPPLEMGEPKQPSGQVINPAFRGSTADYRDLAVRFATRALPEYTRFHGVMPGWDNTARQQNNSFCFENLTPGGFRAWIEEVIAQTRLQHFGDERIVFINAWNEWAEGAYLEPDRRFGHSYLEALRNAIDFSRVVNLERKALGH